MRAVKNIIRRFLIKSRIRQNSKKYKIKIKTINKHFSDNTNKKILQEHLDKWRVFDENITGDWLAAYSRVNDKYCAEYVPESVYYSFIEPTLNDYEHCKSYSDKNIYDLLYREDVFPKTLIRNIDSSYYDHSYNPIGSVDTSLDSLKSAHEELILKPSIDSGGGVNVTLFKLQGRRYVNTEDKLILNSNFLDKRYKTNFVIQKKLNSHPDLSRFNPSSLNTVRVLTYRSVVTNEIIVLSCVLRVGAAGAVVDNSRAGGVAVGVDPKGSLNNFATDKKGNKVFSINGNNLSKEQSIPNFNEIRSVCKDIARKNIHHRLLGLDMTVDEEGQVRCIEINNCGNEINFFQFNNGPVFGAFTDEILSYALNHQRRIYQSYTF